MEYLYLNNKPINNTLWNYLSNLKSSKNYCETIRSSAFTQQISSYPKTKVYQNINDLFMDRFDPTCSILEEKRKTCLLNNESLKLQLTLMKKETNYDKFQFILNILNHFHSNWITSS